MVRVSRRHDALCSAHRVPVKQRFSHATPHIEGCNGSARGSRPCPKIKRSAGMRSAFRLRATHDHRAGTRCRSDPHGLATGARKPHLHARARARRVARRGLERAQLARDRWPPTASTAELLRPQQALGEVVLRLDGAFGEIANARSSDLIDATSTLDSVDDSIESSAVHSCLLLAAISSRRGRMLAPRFGAHAIVDRERAMANAAFINERWVQ